MISDNYDSMTPNMVQKMFLNVFIFFFEILFPIFKNALFTYIVIFVGAAATSYINWKLFKEAKTKWLRYILILIQVFLALFMIWFVIIHFSSYKLIQ